MSILQPIRRLVFSIGRRVRFFLVNLKSPMFRATRIRDWIWILRGFNVESIWLLGLNQKAPKEEYLADINKKRISRVTNIGFSQVLNNKVEFQYFFEKIFELPKLCGVIVNGKTYPGKPGEQPLNTMDALERYGRLVLKPVFGGMGKGILFVDRYGGSITVNGDPKGERELLEMVSGLHQYMICERIQQNQFLSDIYPHTVNSLRVITCLDSNTGEVFIPFAIQRFGTDISAPTDNFSQRGVSAPLDIDSGRMGTVVMKGPNWERLTLSSHPDSGREITGTLLPNWPQVRDEMIRKLEQHPFFDYVGWDVVITQDGFSVIEGNHNQGNYLPHAHYSLLSDQRLRNFFMAKGVIRTTQ